MTIAERAASAKAEETAGLLNDLNWQIQPPWPISKQDTFHQLLVINTPESLLAAAMMVLDDGDWAMSVAGKENALVTLPALTCDDDAVHGYAATPALALIAAVAQSKGL